MQEGNGNRPLAPFGQSIDGQSILKDLTGFEKRIGEGENKTSLRKSFATLTNFLGPEQADAWVDLMMLSYETGRWDDWDYLTLWAESRVSIDGKGREDVLKALSGIWELRERQQDAGDTRKSARRPQQQFV